jgi:hypothetical protein
LITKPKVPQIEAETIQVIKAIDNSVSKAKLNNKTE